MSDSDVETMEMMGPRLSDTDADALIAGKSVAGIPSELSDMLSLMREQVAFGPDVPLSGAVAEFLEEPTASVTPIRTGAPPTRSPRRRSFARKASAGLAIVPAKLLIGATMAAAAVGGAQALGVVNVPMLPSSASAVDTSVPSETMPPRSMVATTLPAAAGPATTVTVKMSQPAPVRGPSNATTSAPLMQSVTPAAAPTADHLSDDARTIPIHAAVDGEPGCEFGQQTSGRRVGESNGGATQRQHPGAKVTAPAHEPCDRDAPDHASTSISRQAPSSAPVDRHGGAGTPPAVSGHPKDDHGEVQAPTRGTEPKESQTTDSHGAGNEVVADPPPANERRPGSGPANPSSGSAEDAEPPRNSGRGRTPAEG